MQEIYQRTLASVSDGEAWDFSSWKADAVVINLGTNDIGSGQYDEEGFAAAYTQLALNITQAYGPSEVVLFLACGPMTDAYCGGVQSVLENLAGISDPSVAPRAAYFLDQTQLGVTLGCCGHPTASDDAAMADAGAAFIMEKMEWVA